MRTVEESKRAAVDRAVEFQKKCPRIGHLAKTATVAGGCKCLKIIGGAEGDQTPGLRIAKWTTGKNVSYCLFESCSHRRKSRVFYILSHFLPSRTRSVLFFWSYIGHVEK